MKHKYDPENFDPKKLAEERKQEMDELSEKLEQGILDVFKGESYKEYLDFCARLPRYSVNNQILIMRQRPDATMCQSYTDWQKIGRFVKKGEVGIRILAPAPYKMEQQKDILDYQGNPVFDQDGEPMKENVVVNVMSFKPTSTFDLSQTDGDPIPEVGVNELSGNVDGFKKLFQAISQVTPVPITFENIQTGAKGYFHLEDNRIAIQEGMSEVQTLKTVIHEAAHQKLHSKEAMKESGINKSRNQKETEAESIAYVVCAHYGMDTSEYSFPYVALWGSDKTVPELKESLETIRSSASAMITSIDEELKRIELDEKITAKKDIFMDSSRKPLVITMETDPIERKDFEEVKPKEEKLSIKEKLEKTKEEVSKKIFKKDIDKKVQPML